MSELKAQGRNLNQLTTLANMGRIQFLRSDELIDRYVDLLSTDDRYRQGYAMGPPQGHSHLWGEGDAPE